MKIARYVDDAFVIQRTVHRNQFLEHINSTDCHIQFTTEDPSTDGSVPFFDTLVTSGPDNTPLTTVYRNPTHTDQYLHRGSHHSLYAKYSGLKTHCKDCMFKPTVITKEEKYIRESLQRCKFPNLTLSQLKVTNTHTASRTTTITNKQKQQ